MSDIKIQPTAWNIDAIKYGIKPADRLILVGPTRVDIQYHNLKGTKENPIKITVTEKILLKGAAGGRVMHFFNCDYIEIDGTDKRLIEITGGNHGITFHDGSNHIKIKNVHIHDVGYSGIDITNYPTCDPKTWRGNGYVMEDITVEDCIITDCRDGEGIYIGPSHYHASYPLQNCKGYTSALEHDAKNINVRNNVIKNIGADGIQVGGATGGGSITGNVVENFGTKKVYGQSSGIQANPGSALLIENNTIKGGTSFGIIVQGRTGTIVRRNRVIGTDGGMMLVARETTDKGVFLVENNTFTDIRGVGIQYYSPVTVRNNVINVTTGSLIFKKDGSGGSLTQVGNMQTFGDSSLLKLDASGLPTAESPIPVGVGIGDYVKPIPVVTKEPGTVSIESTGGIDEVFVVGTSGKRIKIK